MGRALGGWLEGPGEPRSDIPGVRLGLPAHGPGSVAGFGPRLGAYAVDGVLANLLAGVPYLLGFRYDVDARGIVVYAAFLLQAFLLVSVTGQTVGMRLLGLRVVRVRDGGRQSWPWILARTVLLGLLVPVFIWDRDQRGQHDRAAGTVIVRDRVPTATTSATSTTKPSTTKPSTSKPMTSKPMTSKPMTGKPMTGKPTTTTASPSPAPQPRTSRKKAGGKGAAAAQRGKRGTGTGTGTGTGGGSGAT